jgi:formylglycine-generating enzyme required for sulfatase activity
MMIILFAWPAGMVAADEIHLRDGRVIQTRSFWEKNNKIMFEKYGNVVGLPTKIVKEVRSNEAQIETEQTVQTWRDSILGMEFVWIPAGCFNSKAIPAHMRTDICTDGFWMGKYEVANSQFRQFQSSHNNAAYYKKMYLGDDEQPACDVSGKQAQEFAAWLTDRHEGKIKFRLPTGMEWEYASRGGSDSSFFWGDGADQACYYGNFRDASWKRLNRWATDVHADSCYDGYIASAPVGSFKPNGFGLFDILGNVSEWCVEHDAVRGGSFAEDPDHARIVPQNPVEFNLKQLWFGFRLVMEKKAVGGFEIINAVNQYGGKTKKSKKLIDFEKDKNYEKGARSILYLYNREGKLMRQEVHFAEKYTLRSGITKKVYFPNKCEIYYAAEVSGQKGYNKITTFKKSDFKSILSFLNLIDE